MTWDGLFHLAAWTMVMVGVFMLVRDVHRGVKLPTTKAFAGLLILGWGAFNLVEGLIDHHVLNLHHVRDLPAHVPMYDSIFLLVGGAGFIALGRALVGRDQADARFEQQEPEPALR